MSEVVKLLIVVGICGALATIVGLLPWLRHRRVSPMPRHYTTVRSSFYGYSNAGYKELEKRLMCYGIAHIINPNDGIMWFSESGIELAKKKLPNTIEECKGYKDE